MMSFLKICCRCIFFRLWLPEFLDIWETVCNNPQWEQSLISLFSFVAWCNIGYIDWEPWLSRVEFLSFVYDHNFS
jgi:hypothetical protein